MLPLPPMGIPSSVMIDVGKKKLGGGEETTVTEMEPGAVTAPALPLKGIESVPAVTVPAALNAIRVPACPRLNGSALADEMPTGRVMVLILAGPAAFTWVAAKLIAKVLPG